MYSSDWFLEQARLGNMYNACSTGAVTLSSVNATQTGLALVNPWGSGVDLVIRQARFQPSTAPGGASVVGLAVSPALSQVGPTSLTAAVIHNAIASGSNINPGQGKAYSIATL